MRPTMPIQSKSWTKSTARSHSQTRKPATPRKQAATEMQTLAELLDDFKEHQQPLLPHLKQEEDECLPLLRGC
jgi:hypothetical protein